MSPGEFAFMSAYSLTGVVLVLGGVRHFNKGLSILDVLLGVPVGALAGIPVAVIAAVAWLCSQPGMHWLTKRRW